MFQFLKYIVAHFSKVFKKWIKNVLAIITILLARQNKGENHIEKFLLTQNCNGFCHDFLLHVYGRTLKIGIFGLEKSCNHQLLFV